MNTRSSDTIRLESSTYDAHGCYGDGSPKTVSAHATMHSGQTSVMINMSEHDSEETIEALITLARARAFRALRDLRDRRVEAKALASATNL